MRTHRVPAHRRVRAVKLIWGGTVVPWEMKNGWVELTVPRVRIYEVVRVDLA